MAAFEYSRTQDQRTFSAGATRGSLTLRNAAGEPLVRSEIGPMRAVAAPFEPGGAQRHVRGAETIVEITRPGEGRVAVLLVDAYVRALAEPQRAALQLWRTSSSGGGSGVLLVAQPGYQLESRGLNARPWRRWEVQADGSLIEVTVVPVEVIS